MGGFHAASFQKVAVVLDRVGSLTRLFECALAYLCGLTYPCCKLFTGRFLRGLVQITDLRVSIENDVQQFSFFGADDC